MSEKNEAENFDDFVLLGMAGIPEADIQAQVETLTRSPAFEGTLKPKELLAYLVDAALAGKVPRPPQISKDVFHKELFPGDSNVRNTLADVRNFLKEHYARHGKPGEIRLYIRDREYIVYAPPRRPTRNLSQRSQSEGPHSANAILEPDNDIQVHFRTTVHGRLDALSLDLRAWLVIKIPVGLYYPQCRVSRDAPEWEHEVRIGLAGWGTNEDAVYEINLVSAGSDGDTEFYQYVKSARDGFGFVLPSDCRILDTKRVVRRDIRADE